MPLWSSACFHMPWTGKWAQAERPFQQMDESRVSEAGPICTLETLHRRSGPLFLQHCPLWDKLRPHSCVFSIVFISGDPARLLLSTQSVSPSKPPFSRLHVCIRAHYGNGKATNSVFKMRQRFNEFSVLFYGFKGTSRSDGFHMGLESHRRKLENLSFPWHNGPDCHGFVTMMRAGMRNPSVFLKYLLCIFSPLMILKSEHWLQLSCSRTSTCYFKRDETLWIQNNILQFKYVIENPLFLFEGKHQSTDSINILKACQLADLQSWHQRPCPIGLLLKYSTNPLRAAAQGQGEMGLVLKKTWIFVN